MGLPRLPSNKQKKLQPLSNVKVDDENSDHRQSYISWLVEHPSALSSFDRIIKSAKGKKIVVFLDYDGTLSPIVDNPDRAFISDEMRGTVNSVAKYFPTAIISGRSIDKVKQFVQLSNVYYAGSHGMDIMVPPRRSLKPSDGINYATSLPKEQISQSDEVLFQPAKKFLPAMQEIYKLLEQKTKKIQGAMVEDNRFCVSVHFRLVKEEDYGILEERVKSVLDIYPEFHLTRGKKVMEIRPRIEWDKGYALEYFLHELSLSNSSQDVVPLYIGDDQTDEDAFEVIERRGEGYGILVSSIPRPDTKASYSLQDPSQVLAFLSRLARWKKSASSSNYRSYSQVWGISS